MKLVRYFLLLIVVSAVVAGGWVAWQNLFKESPTPSFRASLRMPEYTPEWARRKGGDYPDEVNVRAGRTLPYLVYKWNTDKTADLSAYFPMGRVEYDQWPPIGISLGQVDYQLDVDMGGQRTPVEVDGVQGWFTRLGPDELFEPEDEEESSVMWQEWRFDRTFYMLIAGERRPGSIISRLSGPAIALQWNRDGRHYVLIAQDIEPMNKDELLKMANSMAPSEWPFPSFGSRPG